MTVNVPNQRWSVGVRLLHWLTVVALAVQLAFAFGPMAGPGMASMSWLPLHMSIGVTVIAMILLRLFWRIFTKAPVRPLLRPVRFAGALVHAALYATILAVLITGWLAYRPMPFMPPARLFGSLPLPLAPSVEGLSARAFAMLHARLIWALLGLVGVHVLATLAHAALFRDGVMRGMSFGRPDATPRE
jgi:cytochrome b561